MNYYQILSCEPNASYAQLKTSYQQLILQYHPDKDQSSETTEKYHRIDQAWQTLRDPEKRRIYDAELYQQNIEQESNIFAELNVKTDFTDDNSGTLSYPCRCGDFYEIQKSDIIEETEFLVECNQCSLTIKVKNAS